jgi:hypothetical protein
MLDPTTSLARQAGSTLSLVNLLHSLGVDVSPIVFHNSGNDAFAALLSLQLLLEPETRLKRLKKISGLPPPPSQTTSLTPSRARLGAGSSPSSHKLTDDEITVSRSGYAVDRSVVEGPPVSQSGYPAVEGDSSTADGGLSFQVGLTVADSDEAEEEEMPPSVQASRAPGHSPLRGQPRGRGPRWRGNGQGRRAGVEDGMKSLKL